MGAMRPSNGWTQTNLPRLRSSTRSRRRLRVFATPSSPSCTRTLEVLQEECPEECLTWEAWAVHQVLELLEELAVLVLPSRRSTNRTEPRMTSQSPRMGKMCDFSTEKLTKLKAFIMAFQTS